MADFFVPFKKEVKNSLTRQGMQIVRSCKYHSGCLEKVTQSCLVSGPATHKRPPVSLTTRLAVKPTLQPRGHGGFMVIPQLEYHP